MKVKKPLFLVAWVLLVVVLVLGITGLAVAAPATAVKGDATFVDWPVFGPFIEDEASGTWVWSDNVIVWELSGDLVGTYTMYSTYSGKIGHTADKITGTATFFGTLNGNPIAWSATLKGAGKSDPDPNVFAGRNFWQSTPTSGMKGQITIHQLYEGYGPQPDYAVYWGELK
jgi:hypothetical protein